MPLKIINDFERLSDDNLLAKAGEVHLGISTNVDIFPAPTPGMPAFATTIGDFTLLVSKAKKGSDVEKSEKNDKRAELISMLYALGRYVVFEADDDKTKAQKSGFSIAKEPSPMPPIAKPENLQVTEGGNAGELFIKFKRVIGARSYMIQYAIETSTGEPVWLSQTCTTSKFTLTQLESGKKYIIRVVAVGINEQLMYSDPVSRIVQ